MALDFLEGAKTLPELLQSDLSQGSSDIRFATLINPSPSILTTEEKLFFLSQEYSLFLESQTLKVDRFYLWDEKRKSVVASFYGSYRDQDKTYSSPAGGRGSFGGFHFFEKCPIENKEAFVADVEEYIKNQGTLKLSFSLPPTSYDPSENAETINILLRRGYHIQACELNNVLSVREESFQSRLQLGNQQRLRKTRKQGFETRPLSFKDLPQIYQTICENRTRKGYPLTMTLEAIQKVTQAFPERYFCFGALRESSLAAAAICVQINSQILYVFYWGDKNNLDQYSLTVLLAEEIYKFAQNKNFHFIDFGVSSVDGYPNIGLLKFKQNLGCISDNKFKMEKWLK